MIQLFIPVPFIMAGLVFIVWGSREYQKSAASRTWPRTEGTVISNRVASQQYAGHEVRYRHWADIDIRYEWEGMVYDTGKPALSARAYGLPFWAGQDAGEFPVGRVVTVHVNPADPAQAVVNAGATPFSKLLIGAGLALPVIGLAAGLLVSRFLNP